MEVEQKQEVAAPAGEAEEKEGDSDYIFTDEEDEALEDSSEDEPDPPAVQEVKEVMGNPQAPKVMFQRNRWEGMGGQNTLPQDFGTIEDSADSRQTVGRQ